MQPISSTRHLFVALVLAGLFAGCGSSTFGSSFVHLSSGSSNMAASAKREESLVLPLVAGNSLRLATPAGRIEIRVAEAGAEPSLRAAFDAPGRTQQEAQQALDRYKLVRTDGNGSIAIAIEGTPLKVNEGITTYSLSAKVDFVALVPAGVHVELDTKSGDISCAGPLASARLKSSYGGLHATGIAGEVWAKTSSGDIELSDIAGDATADTSYGKVEARRVKGTALSVHSSSGSLLLADVEAATLEAKTSYGSVEIASAKGQVDAKSSSGNVSARDLSGGGAKLRSGYGAVRVEGAEGALELSSSSGNIQARKVTGSLVAESGYGSVDIDGVLDAVRAKSSSGSVSVRALVGSKPSSAWELHSGYGKVALAVPANFAFELDAKTSYGSVTSDFEILLEAGRKTKNGELCGKIGGGGPLVRLRSSSGDISLRKSD